MFSDDSTKQKCVHEFQQAVSAEMIKKYACAVCGCEFM